MVVIHLCVKLSAFAVSMATAGILKVPSLKTIYTHAIQREKSVLNWMKLNRNVVWHVYKWF
jgi:hypothetical protein